MSRCLTLFGMYGADSVLLLIAIMVWLFGFYDVLRTPADRVRDLPKELWLLGVLLIPLIGAIVWFISGRPRTEVWARVRRAPLRWQAHAVAAQTRRPLGPDDDPEFLKQLELDLRRNRRDDNPAA